MSSRWGLRWLAPLACTMVILAVTTAPALAEGHRYHSWAEFFEAYATKAGAVYAVYAAVNEYQVNMLGRPEPIARIHASWAASVAWVAYDQLIMGPRVEATLAEWVQRE